MSVVIGIYNKLNVNATCKGCDEVYVGETSKNAYTRGLEHLYSVTAPVKDPSKKKKHIESPRG